MKKLFLLVSTAFVFTTTVYGEDISDRPVTRVDFFAYEDNKSLNESRVRFLISGGLGLPEMDKINNYIKWINSTYSGSIDTIDHYQDLNIQLEIPIDKGLFCGISYEYGRADAKGNLFFLGIPHHFTIDLVMHGGEAYIKKRWVIKPERFTIEGTVGAGYYFSDYTEKENGYRVSGDGKNYGARTALALHWKFSENTGMFAEGSYRWLEFNKYKDGGNVITFVSPGNPKVESDFSGLLFRLGLFFNL
jgi:hypothetical protein